MRLRFGFFLFLGSTLISASVHAAPFRIVLDPGHGGSDEGTLYQKGRFKVHEKDITLKIALQVAHDLRAKGYAVTLTRNQDREISLPARTAMANHLRADAFISIHVNSTFYSNKKNARGVETYILNHATDASSKRLARMENAVFSSQEEASARNHDLALILKDLQLDGNLTESKALACMIQSDLAAATSRAASSQSNSVQTRENDLIRNRGVKQALFHVLLGADMPSVLIETGFLNSPEDRALLLSPKGRKVMSRSIARAIDQYRRIRHQLLKSPESTPPSLGKCKVIG